MLLIKKDSVWKSEGHTVYEEKQLGNRSKMQRTAVRSRTLREAGLASPLVLAVGSLTAVGDRRTGAGINWVEK